VRSVSLCTAEKIPLQLSTNRNQEETEHTSFEIVLRTQQGHKETMITLHTQPT